MIFIALLLLVEGLSTGFWFYQIVGELRLLAWVVIVLAVLRGFTGIMQWVGGMSLLMRRHEAVRMCQISLVASAILTTCEIGLRVTPNNLDPTWRWPLTAAYWVYAIAASAFLGRGHVLQDKREVRVDKSAEVREDKTTEAKNTTPDVTPLDRDRRQHDGDSDGREGPTSVD